MRVQTKWFGEIEVSDEKIITFEKGIIGFEAWKKYTLVYDAEKEEDVSIVWLQAVDEPTLALPIMKPEIVLRVSYISLLFPPVILSYDSIIVTDNFPDCH